MRRLSAEPPSHTSLCRHCRQVCYQLSAVSLIEAIPNVSEGRRPGTVARLAAAIRATPAVRLLDHSADPSHNRSVFTLAGPGAAVAEAILTLFAEALAAIDLRTHDGQHPRVGAVDVVPFVPLDGATMAECVALARSVGAEVGRRFGVPVFLYEAAATAPERQRLEHIRRGGLNGLRTRMAEAAWAPDFGPSAPHPSAGVAVIGARRPLIAWNVNLDSDRLDIARAIAARVRESGGGLPCVKAAGFRLAHRGLVQVSMNLTDYQVTSMAVAYDAVRREATRHGVAILESEIIGLVPRTAVTDARALQLRAFGPAQILEERLAGPDDASSDGGAG